MTTKELCEQLDNVDAAWSPVGLGNSQVPAVLKINWLAVKHISKRIPPPAIGERYAYWPDFPFPEGVAPEEYC